MRRHFLCRLFGCKIFGTRRAGPEWVSYRGHALQKCSRCEALHGYNDLIGEFWYTFDTTGEAETLPAFEDRRFKDYLDRRGL